MLELVAKQLCSEGLDSVPHHSFVTTKIVKAASLHTSLQCLTNICIIYNTIIYRTATTGKVSLP